MGVEAAAAEVAAEGDLVPVLGAGVPLHGVTAPPQVTGDGPDPHAPVQQAVDQSVMGL